MGAQQEGTGEQGSSGTLGAQHQCQVLGTPSISPLPFLGPPCSAYSHPQGGGLPLSPQQVSHSIRAASRRGRSPQSAATVGAPGAPATRSRAGAPTPSCRCCSKSAALQEVASHNSLFLGGLLCDRVPTTFASPAAGPCSILGAQGLRSLTSTTAPSPTAAPVLPFQAWRELGQPRAHLLSLSLPTAPEGARLPAPSRGGHRPRDKAQAEAPTPFPNARVHGRDCPEALPHCLAQPMAAPSQPTGTSMGGSWGCPW